MEMEPKGQTRACPLGRYERLSRVRVSDSQQFSKGELFLAVVVYWEWGVLIHRI